MTERIQHPRAAKDLRPPGRVSYAQYGWADVDDEGYFEVPDEYATRTKRALARKHGVEFDDGEVVLPETGNETDTTASAETESGDDADSNEDGDEFDLEAFLDQSYGDRADAVAVGDVDAHLDDIESAETSQTVKDAIEVRRAEIEEE